MKDGGADLPTGRARPRVDRLLARLRRSGGPRRGKVADLLETVAYPDHGQVRGLPPRGPGQIVCASYNIHKCVGVDRRFDPSRIIEVLAEIDADVVALQEADRRIGHRAGLLDLDRLKAATGLELVPVAARPASHGWHGNVLLARGAAPREVRRIELPSAEPRGAVLAELDLPQGPLRVVGAHLGLLKRSRRRQAIALVRALERAEPMPTIMMGDLNEWRPDRPDSPLAALSPLFEPLGGGRPSFPARRPIFALDRIIGAPAATVAAFAVHHSPLARLASDHLPVMALVDLTVALPGRNAVMSP